MHTYIHESSGSVKLTVPPQQWLASHLAKLRRITNSGSHLTQTDSGPAPRRWTLIGAAMKPKQEAVKQPIYLPLSQETANALDQTLQSLRDLACNALFALHVDIRCGVIHMLTRTMAGPNNPSPQSVIAAAAEPTTPSPSTSTNWWHIIASQPTAASPTVLDLNNDLIAFDTNISSYLGPAERWFITSGLARFIDKTFVSCARYIGAMNDNGALRLQLDVLVLQQNLKNIIIQPPLPSSSSSDDPTSAEEDTDADTKPHPSPEPEVVALPRSAKFLDYFLEGAERALDYAKDEKEFFAAQGPEKALAAGNGEPFTYDELHVLVDLCFSDVLRGPRGAESREDFMAAKKSSADALLRLNEVMWDSR